MQIIAHTEDGYLIQAGHAEVVEIIKSVLGTAPKEITIGQKIPAIDYAGTVTKVKSLRSSSEFQYLKSQAENFINSFESLKVSIERASDLEI